MRSPDPAEHGGAPGPGPRSRLKHKTWALRVRTEQRSEEITRRPCASSPGATSRRRWKKPLHLLHLSDLHIGPDTDVTALLQPLFADVERPDHPTAGRIDYLDHSGDITNRATQTEFERARDFVSQIIARCGISAERCVVVPGNHDLDWEEDVYDWRPSRKCDPARLPAGAVVRKDDVFLVRADERYPRRFRNFSRSFHHPLLQQEYPLAPEDQCRPCSFTDHGMYMLAINSCWAIDEHFRQRSSVHDGALSRGLLQVQDQLRRAPRPPLGIAVFHHPATGNEKIVDDAFIGRLQQAGVKICLHGHVHESRADLIGYTHPREQIHVVGAGSFGAPARDRPESVPRSYNVIELARNFTWFNVHTRQRAREGGGWEGWPLWPGTDAHTRRTYYHVDL